MNKRKRQMYGNFCRVTMKSNAWQAYVTTFVLSQVSRFIRTAKNCPGEWKKSGRFAVHHFIGRWNTLSPCPFWSTVIRHSTVVWVISSSSSDKLSHVVSKMSRQSWHHYLEVPLSQFSSIMGDLTWPSDDVCRPCYRTTGWTTQNMFPNLIFDYLWLIVISSAGRKNISTGGSTRLLG